MMFLLPGGLLHAQESGSIEYEENDTGPVATFTATDQEAQKVYWSLLTTLPTDVPEVDGEVLAADDFEDNGDFSISADGVLTFNIRPDHESPDDAGTDNEYNIVVVASDGAPGSGTEDDPIQMGYKKVVVEVTEVDERGVITLSSLQPQVGAALTATLADPEVTATEITAAEWKWERSQSGSSGWEAIPAAEAAALTPDDDDVDHYLRVTATYEDADEDERIAQAVSVNKARAAPETADATAVFPSDPADANNRRVDENLPAGTEVGKPVAATDTADDVLTYSLTGVDAGSFEIDPATGQITVGSRTVLDHETTPAYNNVTVKATEASGDEVDQVVVITVNDVNEAPMVTRGVTMQRQAEDDANVATDDESVLTVADYIATDPDVDAMLEWSVEGADKDLFSIGKSDGALVFKKAPNYEMPTDAGRNNVYNVTVVATDDGVDADGENEMTAMRAVVITVTNVEEDGTVTLSAVQPKAGVALTASVTDLDGGVTDEEWQWSWAVAANAQHDDFTEIDDADSATYTPTDGDVGRFLRATATYTDNKGEDTAMGTASNPVIPRGDHEPEFAASETGKRTISEDAAAGDPVGDPVTATDGDTADILTYRLSGRDAASFTIEQADDTVSPAIVGGEIKVKTGTELDHETKPTYMVTVTATDPGGLSDSIDVTITVTDVNEAPEIIQGGLGISGLSSHTYAEDRRDPVETYTATGPDAASARWSLSGDDMDDFSISSGGVLTFRASPDYENPADLGEDNVYKVTVTANDGTTTATRDVTVTVTDVDEMGTMPDTTLLGRFDANNDGSIDQDEIGTAVLAYQFDRTINQAEIEELIILYQFGGG